MTFVPVSGVLNGALAMAGPVGVAMGCLLTGLFAAASLAIVLGAERRPQRRDPAIELQPPADDRAAAA
jgi:hypothetical protein